MKQFIEATGERHHAARELSRASEFEHFGLTDTAIAAIAPGQFLVLTTDFPLSGLLAHRGVDVINFNRLRPETAL